MLAFKKNRIDTDKFIAEGSFSLRAWNGAFFVCFIDFFTSFRAQALSEAKKINKRNKEYFIPCIEWRLYKIVLNAELFLHCSFV